MSFSDLFVIESNLAGNGYRAIELVNSLSLRSHFITTDPNKYATFQFDPTQIASAVWTLEELGPESLLNFLWNRQPGGIIAPLDFNVFAASVVSREFGLVHSSPLSIVACRHKDLAREKTAGIGRAVRWNKFTSDVQPSVILEPWPCVFKPLNESGGFAVRRCLNPADLEAAITHFVTNRPSRLKLPRREFLLEEELIGDEYSAEVVWNITKRAWDVVAFVKKFVSVGVHCVEIGHICPASFGRGLDQEVSATVVSWLKALDLSNTVAHVEFKMCNDRPALIEVNPRPAGGRIPDIVRATTGIDLIGALLEITLPGARGQNPGRARAESPYAAIAFVLPSRSGNVVRIEWDPDVVEGVTSVTTMAGPKTAPPISNDDRVGSAIALGQTPEIAWLRAGDAARAARIIYEDQ